MQISCEHTDPGVSSELIVRISGLEPGQDVDGEVFGGGLEGGADSFEGAAGSDGNAEFRITITDFGEYDVSVASPALSETYTVTGDCPGSRGSVRLARRPASIPAGPAPHSVS